MRDVLAGDEMKTDKGFEMPGKRYQSGLYPYEVFKSAAEMVGGLDALVKFLNKHYKRGSNNRSSLHGFILERMKVEFSKSVSAIELQMEYATSTIVILVPFDKETKSQLEEKRIKILNEFAAVIPESQFRSTVQFWLSLTPTARKNLKGKGESRG